MDTFDGVPLLLVHYRIQMGCLMPGNEIQRKLRAIFSADVKSYSRLMDDDEEFTIATISTYRQTIADLIQKYQGRVVDAPGDNILAEFNSALNAVNSAIDIQRTLEIKNAKLPINRRMDFRIGINLGDVLHKGDRIYGDGVNVAARIEKLADPGGICISKGVYDQVEGKIEPGFADLGTHTVKNIRKPVRVYKVLLKSSDTGQSVRRPKAKGMNRSGMVAALIALIAVVGGVGIWYYQSKTDFEPASVDRMAYPLPARPSIAVLPFTNLSGDNEQEYLSDGITEDLITDLSKVGGLFVIARNSVFTYKGKPVTISQVAEDLGVRYVLEGSVRRSDRHVRINAQLVDATTGGHIWADRYDGQIDNIFALQDKVTQKIVDTLAVKLTIDEKEVFPEKETNNLEAYLTYLKGWQHYRRFDPESFSKAIHFFEKAIDLDPTYWRSYATLAKIYFEVYKRPEWAEQLGLTRSGASARSYKNLELAMNGPIPLAYEVATEAYINVGDFDGAIAEAENAIRLYPNDPNSNFALGQALIAAGRHREAVDPFKKAMRLDPGYQDTLGYGLGKAYFFMSQFEKSANLFKRAYDGNPNNATPLWYLPAAYAHLDRQTEAENAFKKLRELNPHYSRLYYLRLGFAGMFKDPADLKLLADGLRKAGMK